MPIIYSIKNKITGKFYIGSTIDCKNRWYKHQWELNNKKHHCLYLQRAWNKYGEKIFEFSVFEEWPLETLLDREQYFLDLYLPTNILYNIESIAIKPPSWKGKKHTKDTKQKMSIAAKGRIASPATKRKLSDIAQNRIGIKNGMFGKTLSNKHKEAISKGGLKRIGLNNGRAKPKNINLIHNNGTTYQGINVCVSDVARKLGINSRPLSAVVLGTKKTYKGWKLKCPS